MLPSQRPPTSDQKPGARSNRPNSTSALPNSDRLAPFGTIYPGDLPRADKKQNLGNRERATIKKPNAKSFRFHPRGPPTPAEYLHRYTKVDSLADPAMNLG